MGILQLQQKNISAPAIYTEYNVVVPYGATEVTLQLRPANAGANIFWYMTPTNGSTPGSTSNLPQSPNTYNTIPAGSSRTIRGKLGGQTIYFQVDQTNQLLECDYYSDV